MSRDKFGTRKNKFPFLLNKNLNINRMSFSDYKANVDNCDVVAETKVAKPLLHEAACANSAQLGCSDGTCLPNEYFCKTLTRISYFNLINNFNSQAMAL